jgi:hypothetical protein
VNSSLPSSLILLLFFLPFTWGRHCRAPATTALLGTTSLELLILFGDKPRRLLRHQRAQAHNSTLYHRQHSFMYWLCSKQNCLLCAHECDFGDNDIITIVKTGLTPKKHIAFLPVLSQVSDVVKCNRPIMHLFCSVFHDDG